MNFNQLIQNIADTHDIFQIRAFQSVNMNLTLRNQDRAKYGDAVIKEIAKQFKNSKIKGLSFRNLNLFRKVYLTYPQIVQTTSALFDTKFEKQVLPLQRGTIDQMENTR